MMIIVTQKPRICVCCHHVNLRSTSTIFFNLDLPIPINDAVPIFYRPLRRYFPIVRLVFERVG